MRAGERSAGRGGDDERAQGPQDDGAPEGREGMRVTCDKCGKVYDDVYRWTYCPHERFEMNTTVVDGTGQVRGVAHSVERLKELMEGRQA